MADRKRSEKVAETVEQKEVFDEDEDEVTVEENEEFDEDEDEMAEVEFDEDEMAEVELDEDEMAEVELDEDEDEEMTEFAEIVAEIIEDVMVKHKSNGNKRKQYDEDDVMPKTGKKRKAKMAEQEREHYCFGFF